MVRTVEGGSGRGAGCAVNFHLYHADRITVEMAQFEGHSTVHVTIGADNNNLTLFMEPEQLRGFIVALTAEAERVLDGQNEPEIIAASPAIVRVA